jgi:tRNA-dihydrouridine synthase
VLEAAGADLITIHGRTKAQAYAGVADWKMVGEVKKAVKIPVLVNGDIVNGEKAKLALAQSGADGVLIARGALGNPWIFDELWAALHSGKEFREPTAAERAALVLDHARLHVAQYGERGIVTFRKHVSWYFKGRRGAKEFRERLVRITTLAELEGLLQEWATLHP